MNNKKMLAVVLGSLTLGSATAAMADGTNTKTTVKPAPAKTATKPAKGAEKSCSGEKSCAGR